MTIQEIKDCCIEIDFANMEVGDKSIGTFINEKFYSFRDIHDLELFYSNISLKDLLTIYSSYNGLKCLSQEENLKEQGYAVDILELLKHL